MSRFSPRIRLMKIRATSILALIVPFGCCIADVDVGQLTNGLDRLSFAPQLAEQLANAAVGDAALIESLFSAEIQEDANWRLSLLSGLQGNEP